MSMLRALRHWIAGCYFKRPNNPRWTIGVLCEFCGSPIPRKRWARR